MYVGPAVVAGDCNTHLSQHWDARASVNANYQGVVLFQLLQRCKVYMYPHLGMVHAVLPTHISLVLPLLLSTISLQILKLPRVFKNAEHMRMLCKISVIIFHYLPYSPAQSAPDLQ